MDDIQKSEVVISKILSLLMMWGVQEFELRFEEMELDDEYAVFFFPCINWLEAEGVIRVDDVRRTLGGAASGSVLRPVLTSYGMRVLGTKIKVGEGEIQALSEAVGNVQAGNAQYANVGNFTGGLLASFMKSFV